HMLPGYTHNIINLSETENLVTVMWANEVFDPNRPDTFFEPVE
ncbi:MAG: capsular polysaccharide biosynthesis protein CapF, partial [Ruminococcus sp.]|nr:capsular polysaccharide biosynthesis protein CapF [Ruminococcus sp.]